MILVQTEAKALTLSASHSRPSPIREGRDPNWSLRKQILSRGTRLLVGIQNDTLALS
jgi:hypothetical protein